MSESVYLLVLGQGYTEAWHQMSKEEQGELWSKVEEVDKRAGARWVVACAARWADEAVPVWAVLEYPSTGGPKQAYGIHTVSGLPS